MPLSPGSRVGVYEVTALIGTGGMGEVYRARDSRLERDVAIKVLPDLVSSDHGRTARFEREARTLATLNHPNIAAIHGLEETAAAGAGQDPVKALILELVEGETLADRLRRGPLPLDEALAIAEQIADALEAAHGKGIVHRDLKPANVKITPDGVVKVLDFGLAKVVADASPDLPTVTTATGAGVILGTPAYMAPEQAQGRPVDKRADIWAFGVLLYEMLAGHRPFRGASASDTLAAVLTTDPDWTKIPLQIQPLLRRCLERDPARRLRGIVDFRFLIDHASGTALPPTRHSRRLLVPASMLLAAVALALAAWGWFRPVANAPGEPVRLTTMLPAGVSVTRGPGLVSSVAVSPDGRSLVVAGTGKDGQRLYRRSLDGLESTPIAGTDRGSNPFFSWDGAWIGFAADGRLKRVPSQGGPPVDIAAMPGTPAGAGWGPDDHVVFAYGADGLLHTVNALGGTTERLSGIESGYRPTVLPDGRTVLFDAGGWIHAFDRQTGRKTRLVQGLAPGYAAGHLILSRGTALLAAAFNSTRHELTGPVVPVVEGVAQDASVGGRSRHYAISSSGTLVYVPAAGVYDLVLVEANGTERLVTEERQMFENPQFSPDGRRLVVATTRRDGEPADLWVHDLQTSTATRLTFDGGRAPIWGPDGATVTYSHLGERQGIYTRRTDGRGEASQLVALDAFHWLVGWAPGRTLAYGLMEGSLSSIMALTDSGSRRVVGPGSTWGGRLSPDGRWLAYYSLESGTFEVFVTPFPAGDTRWLIAEGSDPSWGTEGSELYYRSGARLMAARIDRTEGIRVLSHRLVIEPFLPPLYDDYDVHPDGPTLVVVRPARVTQGREVVMVLDWFTELRRLMRSP